MNKRRQSFQTIGQFFLLAICIGLGYLLWEELDADYSNSKNTEGSQGEIRIEQMPDLGIDTMLPSISYFAEIVQRPLFFEDRKPYVFVESKENVNKSNEKLTTTRQPSQFHLSAVIITSGERIAIIQDGKNEKPQKIQLGDTVGGWTLTDVRPRSVKLMRGDEVRNLELDIKGPARKQKDTSKPGRKAVEADNTEQEVEIESTVEEKTLETTVEADEAKRQ
ncbi:MAG: hypothetical protein L0Z68_05695 [Gammaproteobacteria bacterium]|nr:hypothetical protein [Gammaproteobacteria bacterium]